MSILTDLISDGATLWVKFHFPKFYNFLKTPRLLENQVRVITPLEVKTAGKFTAWSGAYKTQDKNKTASITMRLEYEVDQQHLIPKGLIKKCYINLLNL